MHRVLVVDAGNTIVKFTAFIDSEVQWVLRQEVCPQKTGFTPDVIYLASVRSEEQSELLSSNVKLVYPDVALIVLSSRLIQCGVSNAYKEPERLGVDRWLGVVAAHHFIEGDVVVVDVGTAIKVDVVNKDGKHLGGYITPGLAMMEAALISNTARIRYTKNEVVIGEGLPNSTARAVTEGCHEMVLGFLERIYRDYSHYKWVATGGDAKALLDSLQVKMEYQPNLVALGAKIVGDELIKRQ
ncbi:type III pantothenate kinase [Marinomonas posidonica]|uniref:Type III pantothenate kinase n=1 Tax=Marinomonas posidonica (strain CECT 7376 / NCIMB 14433 / IVIA-Po-181) TaxID=491952 RepID=F6CUG9_MARPP|nr:type III pantothenate kinase [Marinomonas posidonica]AEF56389.1 putative transcriptional acitvator, Baf family [Marinomonas posidonica IVIA-Po-181]